MGDFTPGAGLEPWQRLVVLGFIGGVKRQRTNEDRLEAMRQFFANPVPVIEEAKRIAADEPAS